MSIATGRCSFWGNRPTSLAHTSGGYCDLHEPSAALRKEATDWCKPFSQDPSPAASLPDGAEHMKEPLGAVVGVGPCAEV
jgi:hypothetical protein